MKLMLWSLGLFLFFVTTLSSVKYLDGESAHYVKCARYQAAMAQSPFLSANDRRRFIDRLEGRGEALELDGKACPELLMSHKDDIKTRLKAPNSNPRLN